MPAEAIAAPPAPAQAAPATQAPAPAGTVESTPPTSTDAFPGLSADLDDIIGKSGLGTQENEDRVTNKGRKAKEKPAEKPAEKAIAQPPEKKEEAKPAEPANGEQKKEEAKPAEAKPEEAKPAEKQLGPWQRTHAAERKVKELEAKLEEFSKRKPTDDPEKIELSKRYQELEAKSKMFEEALELSSFQDSPKYKKEFYTPYEAEWKRAAAAIIDFTVLNPDGTTRQATANDFNKILTIPNNKEALSKAVEMFGSDADGAFVAKLRADVMSVENRAREAIVEWSAKKEERRKAWESEQKTQQEATAKQQEHYQSIWQKGNEAALEQHKDWFVAAEGDEEGKELLAKGFELADLAWNGSDKLEPEKLVALRSAERNKAAGFRYMVHLKAKADARIAELEKQLKDYQESEPGQGEIDNGEKKDGWSIDAEIARIPRVE